MISNKATRTFILLIVCTIPLIYGARHPLIHGVYSSALLLFCGSVLILRLAEIKRSSLSAARIFPFFLVFFVFLSSLSLPLPLLDILAPVRAESLHAAQEIGGAVNQKTALSYYAPYAQFYAIYGFALLLYFHTLSPTLNSKEFLKKFLLAITIIGTFEGLYGLLQSMNPTLGVLWTNTADDQYKGMARGTIIYRNQYALLLNLCWPAAAALGISLYQPIIARYRSKLKRSRKMTLSRKISHFTDKAMLPLLCSALMILAVLFSQSRGGILTMAFVAILFGYLLPISRKIKISAFLAVFTFVLFYGHMIGGFEEISGRFSQFVAGAEGRFRIWNASLSMLTSHLLTGIGMGNYEFLSPVYLENVAERIWFDRAHNEYLELAIELGLPLVILLYAWLCYGVFRYTGLMTKIRSAKTSLHQFSTVELAAIAAFCSLIAFMLHGFVDLVWRLPANVFYLVSLLGILSCAQNLQNQQNSPTEKSS